MIRLFCGHEAREEPGLHVFISSVLRRVSAPVSFTPLSSQGMSQGSNAFTMSRFLVAQLCDYKGHAIFCDGSDMLVLNDLCKLDALFDPQYAVQVVKHQSYFSRHRRKYVGTELETVQSNYARKNWASVMLVNCEHPDWKKLDLLCVSSMMRALQFSFLEDDCIGTLPEEWNVLVDEGQCSDGASLLHWTAGIPHFPNYASARHADLWFDERDSAWQERRGR